MERYQNNIQDQFGNAISGVTVTVRRVSDGGIATIFSDNIGTGKSNPFTNDADGEFFFYAPNDRYDIFLTGPITDQKDDVLLLDVITTGTSMRVLADLVTATPPTTEAVTGKFGIWDLDETDELGYFGFDGSNTLRLHNLMNGGAVAISAEDAGDVFRNILTGDPDTTTTLYAAGIARLHMRASGVMSLTSDGNTDAENRLLGFEHADGTDRAQVGHIGGTTLTLRNLIHGGQVTLSGEDAGGTLRTIFSGDPDGVATVHHNGLSAFITGSSGSHGVAGATSTDTETILLGFHYQSLTRRGWVGKATDGSLRLVNETHGAPVLIMAEDTGGTLRTILSADPDSTTLLRADTNLELQVAVAETALLAIANGETSLYYNNIESLQTRSLATTALSSAQVKHFDTNFYDIGFAKCIINEISANEDLDNNNQHMFTNKNAGGAVTLELQNSANIQTGTMWLISNEDTENLTINATTNTCTLRWFDGGGGVPGTGNRTLAQAGVCTVIKIGVSEYFIWGSGLT